MGFSTDSTRFLAEAWKAGVHPDSVLTLGRQHLGVGPERIEAVLRANGAWPTSAAGETEARRSLVDLSTRMDAMLRLLGAKTVSACDASAYEGADLVHDLNQPIPAEWEEKFDLVVDGGTLEHVFNFPTAIASCMKMVKTGGHFMLLTPANNYFGHGFYQFSPELFFRVLAPDNGFQVQRMIALADTGGISSLFGVKYPFPITSPWYEVKDPEEVRSRVTLMNDQPILLYILAKKLSRQPIFQKTPQQSDYVSHWKEGESPNPLSQPKRGGSMVSWLMGHLSETFCREILPKLAWPFDPFRLKRFNREHSFKNKKFYRKTDSLSLDD